MKSLNYYSVKRAFKFLHDISLKVLERYTMLIDPVNNASKTTITLLVSNVTNVAISLGTPSTTNVEIIAMSKAPALAGIPKGILSIRL